MPAQMLQWQREHANFSKLLDLIERQLELFHGGERPAYDLMLDVMDYMTQYSDRFHHAKEDLAFKRLLGYEPAARSAVAALAGQHRVIADSGAELVKDLKAVMSGAMLPRQAVESQAGIYVAYLRSHMEREERELFPLLSLLRREDWFLIDSAMHFLADDEGAENQRRAMHRQIAQAAGCGCEI